jgi:hypothetical protein
MVGSGNIHRWFDDIHAPAMYTTDALLDVAFYE